LLAHNGEEVARIGGGDRAFPALKSFSLSTKALPVLFTTALRDRLLDVEYGEYMDYATLAGIIVVCLGLGALLALSLRPRLNAAELQRTIDRQQKQIGDVTALYVEEAGKSEELAARVWCQENRPPVT
jgi:hypothetical protein